MSIIIFGPQGCGKTRHAEALRRYFNLGRVVDENSGRDFPRDLYRQLARDPHQFRAGDTLYLTNEAPAEEGVES